MRVTWFLALLLSVALPTAITAEQAFYVNNGGTTYHRLGCSWLQDDAQSVEIRQIMSHHYFPCPLCRPLTSIVRPADLDSKASEPSPSNGNISLPWTTHVYLRITKNLSAKKAKVGDRVELEVSEDVTRDGVVVIARGAPAVARVVTIVRRGMKGKAGRIQLEVLSTTDILGDKVVLDGLIDETGAQGFKMEDVNEVALNALAEPGGVYFVAYFYPTAYAAYLLQCGSDAVLLKGLSGRARLAWNISYDRTKLSEANRQLQLERTRSFSGNARLYLYRSALKHRGRIVSLYLDGAALPPNTARQVLRMLVPPGTHVLSTRHAQLELHFDSEREYYIRLDDLENFTLVEDRQGNYETYALEAVPVDLNAKR